MAAENKTLGPSPRPASARVADLIRQDIAAGRIKIGDRLPTRAGLHEQYGIAAATAAKVIRTLVEEGTAYSAPGQGVFVAAVPDLISPRPVNPLESRLRGIEARLALIEHAFDRGADEHDRFAQKLHRSAGEQPAAPSDDVGRRL